MPKRGGPIIGAKPNFYSEGIEGFPLYEAHQIGRATTGEPKPLE